ncbi:histidine-specific methyltransferase [Sphaerosporella brunnea]|uniref:Histidine-specific methyltransferase n=1 Tax=Sphaerosporella brunnea TaxID=1250544 RepID=A0A5J5EF02_9PEZI|nr:histidine-specific methyltransferase [Sphaerosporella brunnea]
MAPLHYTLSADGSPPKTNGKLNPPRIVDIRREKLSISLVDEISKGLNKDGEKTLPTLLLYSAEGLKLFEDITYLDEYYLTNTEIGILEKHSAAMAERVEDGSVVVELGSGNLRKVNIFLRALERLGKRIDYYALDLDLSELQRTLDMVPRDFKNVRFNGLHGTYEDGREWLKSSPEVKDRPRCILWLGSSAGNYTREGAAQFLKAFAGDALRPGKQDYMLVGLDGCKDGPRVYTAYNDPHGYTEKFIMSGLSNANEILGGEYFKLDDWEYVGEWNAEHGRHQAYYVPRKDIRFGGKLDGVNVQKGERVNVEYSYKFDETDARILWEEAGLTEGAEWANENGDYCLHLLQKPSFTFPSKPEQYAAEPTPTMAEWRGLWQSWTAVTLGMIPKDQLLSKPIDLRNPCIFYLGHIATFLDSLIVRATEKEPMAPKHYQEIFLRGIDPDVDNPERCHPHSEIPECWPDLEPILAYQSRVRERVQEFYRKGSAKHQPTAVKRALWIGFEHEAMHLETLLYMLVQSDSTLPPQGAITPDFVSGKTWERRNNAPTGDAWVKIPDMTLDVGLNDPEEPEDERPHFFGWDNEKPMRKNISVSSFIARTHPITNEEYAKYLVANASENIPASWAVKSGVKNGQSNVVDKTHVRTVFGLVPLRLAADWPVMASYDELEGCARWMNSRIPTADEVRAIYQYAEELDATVEKKLTGKIDAVNG